MRSCHLFMETLVNPLAIFLTLPLRERLAILAGGFSVALGGWVFVVAVVVLGGSAG